MSIKTKTVAYGIVAIAVALIVVGAAVFAVPPVSQQTSTTTGVNSQTGTTKTTSSIPMVIQLTDPPSVPNGTRSLNMRYNSISIHIAGGSGPASWVNSSASGVVDLLSLVNVSKTLTVIQVPKDSSVDLIRFNMSSVTIDVNGTTYPVSISNSILTVPLIGGDRLENLSAALLQLNPTVHEIITNNTSIDFYLVPSATGIVKNSGVNQNETEVGAEQHLNQTEIEGLNNAHGNVSISSVLLSSSGNNTVLTLTLENNGNVSVTLSAIALHGSFNSTGIYSTSSCTTNVENTSSSAAGDYATTSGNSTSTGEQGDHHARLNSTSTTETSDQTTTTSTTTATASPPVGEYDANHDANGCGGENNAIGDLPQEVVFAANGTQLIALSGGDGGDQQVNAAPVVLAPGQSETFAFNGIIGYSFGDQSSHTLYLTPIIGSTYRVQADLSNDVHTTIQVNATS